MLDLLTAAPKEIKFGDEVYRVGALKLKEIGLLQGYLREHTRRPTAIVKERIDQGLIAPEDQRAAQKEAVYAEDSDWPPSPMSSEGRKVLFGTPEGARFFLELMFRKYQDLDDEQIDAIEDGLSEADFALLAMIGFGEDSLDPEQLRATIHEGMTILRAAQNASQSAVAVPTGASSSSDSPSA